MIPTSWVEAKSSGALHYSSGVPCKRGHLALRVTSSRDCVECHKLRRDAEQAREYRRKKYWQNPEAAREYARKLRAENLDAVKESGRKRYAANPGKSLAMSALWKEKNRDRVLAYSKKWAKENPDRARATAHARRARKRCAPGRITSSQLSSILEAAKRCYYCHAAFTGNRKKTVDHVFPLKKGGAHDASNIVVACGPCNSSKKDRLVNPVTKQGILL